MIDAPFSPSERVGSLANPVEKTAVLLRLAKLWPLLLIVIVFLGTTGALPLVGRDEPRYVQVAREMLQSGDWITPRLGGFHWFEKPALLYWLVAASFSVFGVSEWSARLGAALCGVATVAFLWQMVRVAQPQSENPQPNASASAASSETWLDALSERKWAFWSALSLASSGGIIAFSHGATFDIVLTFAVSLSLYGFYRAQIATKPSKVNFYLSLFWAGVGLACLAKGLVAFILTLGTVGIYYLVRRERIKLGLWWGLPLALLVAALWYGPMFSRHGMEFWNEFFVKHHFQRFTSDKYKHHQPLWFYLEILPLLAFPWTPFFLAALWKIRLPILRRDSNESRLLALGAAWTLIPIAFFSFSGSKLPGYILPALPGAFVLIGWSLDHWTKTARRVATMQSLAVITLALVGVVTCIGPAVRRADKESVRQLFRVAAEKNLGHLPVVQYQTTQRAAQFYAANQMLYGPDHEPVRFEKMSQLAELAHEHPVLVLSDSRDARKINRSLQSEIVDDNGNTALTLVR